MISVARVSLRAKCAPASVTLAGEWSANLWLAARTPGSGARHSRYWRFAPNAPTMPLCSTIPAASAWPGP